MDCLGVCNGTAIPGKDERWGSTRCCDPGDKLDCFGVCGGTAVHDCLGECGGMAIVDCFGICNGTQSVDACGICGGSDVSFCPRVNISVDTGDNPFNSDHHVIAVYDASDPYYTSHIPITVSNVNSVDINVSFSYSGAHVLPPFMTLPTDVFRIQPYENITFCILSNISGLFDQYDSWAVNGIVIR